MSTRGFSGERLRGLRNRRGLSQKKVATEFGITEIGYQNYEAGRRSPSITMLYRLADFYDVSTDYLLGRTDEPQLPDKETLAMLRQLQAYRVREATK